MVNVVFYEAPCDVKGQKLIQTTWIVFIEKKNEFGLRWGPLKRRANFFD